MDRRTLTAVFLCLAIYYTWLVLRGPAPVPEGEPLPGEPVVQVDAPTPPVRPPPQTRPVVAAAADHPVRELPFSACDAEGVWTTDGGALKAVHLRDQTEPYEVMPLYSWLVGLVTGSAESPWKPYGETPGPVAVLGDEARGLVLGTGGPDMPPTRMEVLEEGGGRVVLQGVTSDGITVRQELAPLSDDPCLLSYNTTWTNTGSEAFEGDLWVAIHDAMPEAAGGMLARYMSVRSVQAWVDGDVEMPGPEEVREATVDLPGPVAWFGLADRYFGLVALPDDREGAMSFTALGTEDTDPVGAQFAVADALAAGATVTASFRVYVGPLNTDILRAIDEDLVDVVDYGWFSAFAFPLLWLMKIFYAGVSDWGLAILMLTVTVKLIFFPLTQTAFKSSQAMQAIQPELQALREEHKDNQEELNRKMMELFKENGVNPLGGCLPMLIQFPVWIALYNVLLSTVDLYHTEFLYLRDLSSPDPYCLLPVVVIILMLIQQQFTPMGNMDPAQARMMKLMPLMFGFFFFMLPSGLVLYIFTNMLLSILQQWLIKRNWNKPGGGGTVAATTQPSPSTGK